MILHIQHKENCMSGKNYVFSLYEVGRTISIPFIMI
jgi:hypothetical protein